MVAHLRPFLAAGARGDRSDPVRVRFSTYGDVAGRAGSPRAARAAGNALHDNPVPIVVPCHRVVPSSGGIGKYGGNEWRKAYLLRLEGALAE